jgi:hypothetical protein
VSSAAEPSVAIHDIRLVLMELYERGELLSEELGVLWERGAAEIFRAAAEALRERPARPPEGARRRPDVEEVLP